MGATYTRQSTYADGDTITSDHTNDEFDQLLAAFAASTGHTHDGTTAEGGPVTKLLGTSLTFGNGTSGTDITVTFDGESNDGVLKWMEDEDYFEFSDDLLISAAEKIQFRDTGLFINSSADGQLDIVADTEVQIAATTVDINGNVDISGTLTVAGALDFGDAALSNVGALQLDSIAGDADTNTSITFSGSDVITFTNGGETQLTFNNGSILPTTNNDVDLGSDALEFKDIYIDGTAFLDTADIANISADTIVATNKKIQFRDTGLSINSSADGQLDIIADTEVQIAATTVDINGAVDVSGNLVVGGDLTITGDDLIMNTNTAGALLIADGTNFNPTVITDLSEIGTAASGDILLAIDASGGGLKKITRSTLTAGLASDSAISNLVEDTSPQLGGNLDTNSQNILIDDAHFIADESGNEQIIFQTTGSAVNQFDVTNAASGNGPKLSATGGDTNIDLDLLAKGSGIVKVISPGGSGNSGAIQLNCESNSHGQILKSQPHSASATNTMLLPEGANSTLVSLVSSDTLTNKTLTAPKIADGGFIADANGNELVVFQTTGSAVNELEITNNASGSDPIIAATGGDTNIGITLTPKGTGVITIAAGNLDYGGTAVTSTGAELNALDGITAVVGELNALDLGSTAVGTAIASKAVILDSNKDYTGIRNLTISGEIDAATGDFSGVVDVAGALTTAAITASGIIKTDDSTAATSTTDGSLQTDGGLSVVLDAVIGDDLFMLSDASVIHFGADSDITLTHNADVGLALKHTATADDKPIVLTLQTGETDMAANDVIGKLAFQAPDEGTGTDAILVAAAVQAVAEGNFSSSNNATRLEFHTGASELAAVKMTLNSTGAVKPVTYQETYVSLTAAGTVDLDLLSANHFAVTMDENTTFTFSDPPASGTSFAFTLIVTQHSTAVTLTWPNTVDWAGGSAPDAANADEVQAYGFITRDGGTTYYGFLGGTAIG